MFAPHLDKVFPPYLSTYREKHNTQHVLIQLIEEWKEHLDNNYVAGGLLMNQMAFPMIYS